MWTAEALSAAVEPWPDKVSTHLAAYCDQEEQDFVKAQGETLTCIRLNGEHEFTLDASDGKHRAMRLVGPPGECYAFSDLAAILKQQCDMHCGEEREGFAEALGRLERAGAAKGD